jgi:hypothetical protein
MFVKNFIAFYVCVAIGFFSCRSFEKDEGAKLQDDDIFAVDVNSIPRTTVFVMKNSQTDDNLIEVVLWTSGRLQGQDHALLYKHGVGRPAPDSEAINLGSRMTCRNVEGTIRCTRDNRDDGGGVLKLIFLRDRSGKFDISSIEAVGVGAGAPNKVSYGKGFEQVSHFDKAFKCTAGEYSINIDAGLPGGTIGVVSHKSDNIAPHLASLNCTERYASFSCQSYGIFDSGFTTDIQASNFQGKFTDFRQRLEVEENITCSAINN